jgi:hypothetical protein
MKRRDLFKLLAAGGAAAAVATKAIPAKAIPAKPHPETIFPEGMSFSVYNPTTGSEYLPTITYHIHDAGLGDRSRVTRAIEAAHNAAMFNARRVRRS